MKKEIKIKESYHLMHPRPAVLITAFWKKPNVMTCAWNMPITLEPTMVGILLGEQSYTAKMIKKSKEFVINFPGRKLLKEIKYCGSVSGKNIDKIKKCGLHYEKARKVKAPLIKECQGHLECRLVKHIIINGDNLFIGKVVASSAENYKKVWKTSFPSPESQVQ